MFCNTRNCMFLNVVTLIKRNSQQQRSETFENYIPWGSFIMT